MLGQIREREETHPDLKAFITGMLENDPRPAYKTETDSRRIYGIRIFDVDVKWSVDGNRMEVMGLES